MRDRLASWRPRIDEAIESLLPRAIDEEYLQSFFGEPSYAYDPDALQVALADPMWDLLDRGGKRWRAVLFLVLVDGLGADPEAFLEYACIPEILHNGTIVVDDVEDGAEMRRGDTALHLGRGTDIALNAGNAMYFLPLKVITQNPAGLDAATRLETYEMLMHELNRTHLGQGMDIAWHNEPEIRVGEDEYLEMTACKTGCLVRIVTRLAAIVTGQPDDVQETLGAYAEDLSIAFQISDDVLDIENTLDQTGEFGKAFGNDVREGKKTLMVIHAAEHADPEDVARLEAILWADETTDEEVMEAIEILQSTDSIEYARDRAAEFAASATAHLDDLDLDPDAAEALDAFATYVVDRDR
ncbi:MAG: polyprenyl synthetase family protein [Halococcoides sp.]